MTVVKRNCCFLLQSIFWHDLFLLGYFCPVVSLAKHRPHVKTWDPPSARKLSRKNNFQVLAAFEFVFGITSGWSAPVWFANRFGLTFFSMELSKIRCFKFCWIRVCRLFTVSVYGRCTKIKKRQFITGPLFLLVVG